HDSCARRTVKWNASSRMQGFPELTLRYAFRDIGASPARRRRPPLETMAAGLTPLPNVLRKNRLRVTRPGGKSMAWGLLTSPGESLKLCSSHAPSGAWRVGMGPASVRMTVEWLVPLGE